MKLNKNIMAFAVATGMGLSGQAFAAATYTATTAAGTDITNSITLGFKVNNVDQTLNDSLTFEVDNKVDLSLINQESDAVSIQPNGPLAGASEYVITYALRNDGNSTQDYTFTVADLANGTVIPTPAVTDSSDTATTSAFKVFSDSAAGAGTFDAATDTSAYVNDLAPGETINVYVVIDSTAPVAATLVDGDIAGISLTAITQAADINDAGGLALTDNHDDTFDPAVIQVVFADTDNDGQESDTSAFIVESSDFTDPSDPTDSDAASLTVIAINDFICEGAVVAKDNTNDYSAGGCPSATAPTGYIPKALPGAMVKFDYSAKNSGSQAATQATFSIALDATYVASSLDNVAATNAGTPITAANISNDGTTLNVTLGTIATDGVIGVNYTALVK